MTILRNPTSLTSSISGLASASPIRSAVNQGFLLAARRRVQQLQKHDPVAGQARVLNRLLHAARDTQFGRDHKFANIRTPAQFAQAVPIRKYEDLWNDYLSHRHPVYDNLTWPGKIPYLALTSGTTLGNTKWIPVSHAMLRSNRKAAKTMIAFYQNHIRTSRLFHGKLFFLGGSTNLAQPAPGVLMGDLSAIAVMEVNSFLRPYTFPPPDLALETDWDVKIDRLAARSIKEPITLLGGVPSWLTVFFQRVLAVSGKSTIAEVWPQLELIVHGGMKFDPYRETFRKILGDDRIRLQESYPCSEGFIAFGDPVTELLRLVWDHGIFYEFIPVDELESANPTRHWLGDIVTGVNYAIVVSTCAGMWAHLIGDTVRFEQRNPPLLTFTGRTKYTLSAFGEHLINEEVETALATAAREQSCAIADWHVGPVFTSLMGYHRYLVEFAVPPHDLSRFAQRTDALLREKNADYDAHRDERVGMQSPEFLAVAPGGYRDWMKSRGKLGGQHKVPRMDSSGVLTQEITRYFQSRDMIISADKPGADAGSIA